MRASAPRRWVAACLGAQAGAQALPPSSCNMALGRDTAQCRGSQVGEPAAAAALTAGLRPRALSKAELRRFAQRTQPYLEARNAILLKWAANPTEYLTAEACIGRATVAGQQQRSGGMCCAAQLITGNVSMMPGNVSIVSSTATCCAESTPSEEAMTREAHAFLHEHCCINTGVISNEPPREAATLSDEELAWRTRQILKTADMQVRFIACHLAGHAHMLQPQHARPCTD